MLEQVLRCIDARRARSVDGLKEFLRIPSVSAKPEHAADMQRCARWLADQFTQIGLEVSVEATGGHPLVLAAIERQAGRPTVLLYGHYDVQPPEPLELWTSPPFEPAEREGAIYARGAADDKGQVWAHVEAMRAWQEQGGLPVNVIALIEGEEEIGSENLDRYFASHKSELAADIAVISDTGQFARGVPALTYALRGIVYMEVFITAANVDLHSGLYGGTVPNAANVLAELLATLHDAAGCVNIPAFYDDVQPLAKAEREEWGKLPFDEDQYARELNLPSLSGEAGFTTLERKWARPTCDIHGLTSGYQGIGGKTVIPAKASAKVSMRLVPNQDPQRVERLFIEAMRRCPGNVTIEFKNHGLARPVLVPREGEAMRLAARAMQRGFGIEPVLMREGGTIPVVAQIKSVLGIDTLLVGFGLPDDRLHAPNEKFDLDALHCGTRTAAALYEELASMKV